MSLLLTQRKKQSQSANQLYAGQLLRYWRQYTSLKNAHLLCCMNVTHLTYPLWCLWSPPLVHLTLAFGLANTPQDFDSDAFLSFSVVRLHVVLGYFPSAFWSPGESFHTVIVVIFPKHMANQLRRRSLTSSLVVFLFVILRTSLFDIRPYRPCDLQNLLRRLNWK